MPQAQVGERKSVEPAVRDRAGDDDCRGQHERGAEHQQHQSKRRPAPFAKHHPRPGRARQPGRGQPHRQARLNPQQQGGDRKQRNRQRRGAAHARRIGFEEIPELRGDGGDVGRQADDRGRGEDHQRLEHHDHHRRHDRVARERQRDRVQHLPGARAGDPRRILEIRIQHGKGVVQKHHRDRVDRRHHGEAQTLQAVDVHQHRRRAPDLRPELVHVAGLGREEKNPRQRVDEARGDEGTEDQREQQPLRRQVGAREQPGDRQREHQPDRRADHGEDHRVAHGDHVALETESRSEVRPHRTRKFYIRPHAGEHDIGERQ